MAMSDNFPTVTGLLMNEVLVFKMHVVNMQGHSTLRAIC